MADALIFYAAADVTPGVFLAKDGVPHTRLAYVPDHIDPDKPLRRAIADAWRRGPFHPEPLRRSKVTSIAALIECEPIETAVQP